MVIGRYLLVLSFLLVGCNENKHDEKSVPTGKGKIYGKLNERKIPCRLVTVERNEDMNAWQCIFDHPKSEVHDVVTVGEHYMCPNMIYCDKR
mgnify:FL=1|tara:strand:+ start:808 stop:1083 length:276 start_codon:yes stop_codon:yes gene_type:complete